MKKCADVGYMIEDALRRGCWAALFLAAFLIVLCGGVTL